ncbi:hypothetical protein BT93_F0544 [Corymbia citriodora subsp. variegata]|nr:hypothetical protein BT93_F0544 [Corymbia citriodora subsp. variegata]
MRTKTQRHNRFVKIMMIPLRALTKARDLYVRGLNYADRVGYGNVGCPAGQFSAMPRSFSVSSSRSSGEADDLGELIRVASARSFGNKIDVDAILQRQQQQQQRHLKQRPSSDWGPKVLPKSCSVAMGRIDEEEPCEFGGDEDAVKKADLLFPRSRSYAIGNRNHVH